MYVCRCHLSKQIKKVNTLYSDPVSLIYGSYKTELGSSETCQLVASFARLKCVRDVAQIKRNGKKAKYLSKMRLSEGRLANDIMKQLYLHSCIGATKVMHKHVKQNNVKPTCNQTISRFKGMLSSFKSCIHWIFIKLCKKRLYT